MPQFNGGSPGGSPSASPVDTDVSGTHRVVPHRDIVSPSEMALLDPASDEYTSIDGAPKPWSGQLSLPHSLVEHLSPTAGLCAPLFAPAVLPSKYISTRTHAHTRTRALFSLLLYLNMRMLPQEHLY